MAATLSMFTKKQHFKKKKKMTIWNECKQPHMQTPCVRIDINTYLQFPSGILLSDYFQHQFIYLMVNFSPKCLLDFRHQLLVCLLDRRASVEFCGVVWRFAAVAHSIDYVILGSIRAHHVTIFFQLPEDDSFGAKPRSRTSRWNIEEVFS